MLQRIQGGSYLLRQDAAVAEGDVPVNHQDAPRPLQGVADLLAREGAERPQLDQPHRLARLAPLVHDEAGRAAHRPRRQEDGIRLLDPVSLHQTVAPPELPTELLPHLGNHQLGQLHRLLELVPEFHVHVHAGPAVERVRIGRIQPDFRLIRGQKLSNLVSSGNGYGLVGVGQVKTLQADHHGNQDRLGDPVCLQDGVEDLLVALAVELNPARIPLGQAVVLVRPENPGRRQRPIHVGHHDGQPRPGRPVKQLVHQGQSLGTGGSEGPGAGGGSTDAGRHGRVLGLHHDEARGHLPGPAGLGQLFRDRGLGGDGIGRDHRRSGKSDGESDRVIARDNLGLVTHDKVLSNGKTRADN